MPAVVYLLGLTIFSLTTSEFMVAGMMPSLGAAFDVSVPQIGNLISLYAAGMVFGGPLLTAALIRLRIPDREALLGLLVLYAIGQAVGATTDAYVVMAAVRFVTGVVASACFGAALAICADVSAPEARGRAASIALGGLMLSAAVGVPLATVIDQHLGWRLSFWLVTVLTLACAAIITVQVPRTRSYVAPSLATELREFRNGHLWAAYATSALIIGATFSAFSYFTPILTTVAGLSHAAVPWLLAGYGVANIVGNAVVGHFADKHTFTVKTIGLAALTAAMVIFALFAQIPAISVAMVVVVGLTGVTMNPAMVARVMRTARPGPLVNTLHASVINIGIGLGAWAGGVGIDAGYGLRSPLWVAAALAAAGLASLLPYLLPASATRNSHAR